MLIHTKRIYTECFILCFYLVISLIIFGLIIGSIYNVVYFDQIGYIELITLILYIFCIIICLNNQIYLSVLLPFIYIAFPANINNFFPGVYLENASLQVIYPLFDHVELFLLICIMYYSRGRISPKVSFIILLTIISFICSTLYNIFKTNDIHYICLLISGMYPVRLLIYTVLLINIVSINSQRLVFGLGISVLFLIFEASITTILTHSSELVSASLGVNTFGNVLAQVSCALLFYYLFVNKCNNWILYISLIGCVATILTGTRMAILSSIVVMLFIIYPKLKRSFKIWILFIIAIILLFTLKIGFEFSQKYNIRAIFDAIDFSSREIDITRNEATTSIITRLELWKTSIMMFINNPLTGIGWNLFNVLKYQYGFEINVIIDSHNGYLSFISQLGISGLLWIYLLYIKSWMCFKSKKNRNYYYLLIFNMGMSICELTNAGSYKFGILSLLILFSLLNYRQFPAPYYLKSKLYN